MKQEHHDHNADDNRFCDEVPLQGVDRCVDEPGTIVAGNDFHARRKALFYLGEFRLDVVDDRESVLTIAHHDDAADGLPLPVPFGDSFAQVGAEAHNPKIAHQNRRAVVASNRNVLQVAELLDIAHATDHVIGAGHLEHAPADLVVAVANLVDHHLERNVQRKQAVRVELHLVLSDESTDSCDLRHAWDGFELVAYIPLLQGIQVGKAQVMALVEQDVLVHPAGAGCVGADYRVNVRRQPPLKLLHVLEYAAA